MHEASKLDISTHSQPDQYLNDVFVKSGVLDFSIRTKATKAMVADHQGKRFHLALKDMAYRIAIYMPDLILYEMVVGGKKAGGNTSMIQKGLEACLLSCAYQRGSQLGTRHGTAIPCVDVSAGSIKKWATGNGTLSTIGKQEMIAAAKNEWRDHEFRRVNPTKAKPWNIDDNEVDAMWLADLGVAIYDAVPDVQVLEDPIQRKKMIQLVTAQKWNRK